MFTPPPPPYSSTFIYTAETHSIIVAFDNFNEQCGSVLLQCSEELQEVAIIVKVHQNPLLLNLKIIITECLINIITLCKWAKSKSNIRVTYLIM